MKKQLFSSVICLFLIICFTPFFIGNVIASADEGMVEINPPTLPVEFSGIHVDVSALGTFLRANPNMEEGESPVQEPTIIDLDAEGLSDLKWVLIKYSGEIFYAMEDLGYGTRYVDDEIPLIGLFSSTSELKSIDNLNRVPGAINSGQDHKTTGFGNVPTDISEDFIIKSFIGNNIEIPSGAKYLFLCFPDIYYPDNSGTIQVTITKLEFYQSLTFMVGTAIAAIAIITVVAWLITRPPKPSTTKSAVNAHLHSLGSGKLEFIDNTLSFHLEKGYFRNQTKNVREIPTADIKSMNRTGNELSITWKGVTDIFIIEETELAGTIFEMIPQTSLEQRRMFEDKEAANQKRNELIDMLSVAMEVVDSLFDILRSLYWHVDWNRVEGFLKRSEENARHLKDKKLGARELDFALLSLAVKKRLPEEISKETLNLLRLLHDYFSGLASANESLEQIHPNDHDAKTTIQAYYLLNDIILGVMVGDRAEKEINALVVMLGDLSKKSGLKINISALKDTIDKLGVEQEKESVFEESRMIFRKQLEDFKKIDSSRFIKPSYPPLKPSTVLRAKKFFRLVQARVWERIRVLFGRISKRTREIDRS